MKKKQLKLQDYILTPTGTKLLITNMTEEYYICGVRYISRDDVVSGRYTVLTELS